MDASRFRAPLPTPAHVMPLDEFPPEHRRRILEAVAQPKPPPKWLNIDEMAQIPSRAWKEWYRARGIDPDKRRESIPKWMRRAVIERDGYVCGLCGGAVEPGDVHVDHVIPWSRGGADHMGNLQVAHSACNIAKGAKI